jgi:hypothetical protein
MLLADRFFLSSSATSDAKSRQEILEKELWRGLPPT